MKLWIPILVFSLAATPVVAEPSCKRTLADRTGMCMHTLSEMRTVQTAVEAYYLDHQRFPAAASMEEVRQAVEPVYIMKTPTRDAWGTEFRYVVAPDGQSYRLVSAGSDKTFDETTWTQGGLTSSSKDDAVIGTRIERQWTIQE